MVKNTFFITLIFSLYSFSLVYRYVFLEQPKAPVAVNAITKIAINILYVFSKYPPYVNKLFCIDIIL